MSSGSGFAGRPAGMSHTRLRDVALVALAATAIYTATHRTSVPPAVLAPVDQLGRFDPFSPQPVKNRFLLDPLLKESAPLIHN